MAAIIRISGDKSVYTIQAQEIIRDNIFEGNKSIRISGIVEALRIDVNSSYLEKVSELIHGEIISDFLEMATYLQDNGFKDAAAVIAGSTLEIHLRSLCNKNGISTVIADKPKKADLLNPG